MGRMRVIFFTGCVLVLQIPSFVARTIWGVLLTEGKWLGAMVVGPYHPYGIHVDVATRALHNSSHATVGQLRDW